MTEEGVADLEHRFGQNLGPSTIEVLHGAQQGKENPEMAGNADGSWNQSVPAPFPAGLLGPDVTNSMHGIDRLRERSARRSRNACCMRYELGPWADAYGLRVSI